MARRLVRARCPQVQSVIDEETSHRRRKPKKTRTPRRSKRGAAGPCVMYGSQATPIPPAKWGTKIKTDRLHATTH